MLALQDRAQDLRAKHAEVVAACAQLAACPYEGASFAAGLARVQAMVAQAAGRIEVVVGGGVEPENADVFATALPGDRWSLHAYSGVRMDGRVRAERVRALVECGGGR